VIAFTAFAFEDSMDNGGVSEKLKLIRAQGKKVASRIQRKAARQQDGSIRLNGEVIRNKGDVQTHRIANKVIKAAGDTSFLGARGEGIHTGITEDFSATPNGGMARKDKQHISAP
jgi:hypothetical protein